MYLTKHDIEYLTALEQRHGKGETLSKKQMVYFQEKTKFEMEQLLKERDEIINKLSNPSIRGKEKAELMGKLYEIDEKIEDYAN